MNIAELRECYAEYDAWLKKWHDRLSQLTEPSVREVEQYIVSGNGDAFDISYLDESEGLWMCHVGVAAMLYTTLHRFESSPLWDAAQSFPLFCRVEDDNIEKGSNYMNWIQCSERLPEMIYAVPTRSAMVIVRHMSGGIGIAFLTMSWKETRIWVDNNYQRLTSEDECDLTTRITHWLPLPRVSTVETTVET